MDYAEVTAWHRRAPPATIAAVAQADVDAVRDWLDRVCTAAEMEHVAPWCASPLLFPAIAAEAAGQAALELAIVCSIWPNELGAALRPRWRAPKKV